MNLVYKDGKGNNEAVVYEGASANGLRHIIRRKDGTKIMVPDCNLEHLHQMSLSNLPSTPLDYCKEVGKSVLFNKNWWVGITGSIIFHLGISLCLQQWGSCQNGYLNVKTNCHFVLPVNLAVHCEPVPRQCSRQWYRVSYQGWLQPSRSCVCSPTIGDQLAIDPFTKVIKHLASMGADSHGLIAVHTTTEDL